MWPLMEPTDARRLSPEARGALRGRCVQAVQDGLAQAQAAAPLKVARARQEGARIGWGDGPGLPSRHHAGTTFGPRGTPPVVRATGEGRGGDIISAMFQDFMARLLREAPGRRVSLILDDLTAPRRLHSG